MPLDSDVRSLVRQALEAADAPHSRSQTSIENAERLFARVRLLHGLAEVGGKPDFDAIELACMALQIHPKANAKSPAKSQRPTLKDRTALSVEFLASLLKNETHAELVDATSRLLNDISQRLPESAEARLLADALNLEDFGVLGLVSQFVGLVRQGLGPSQLVDSAYKREQYGYWDARLKDGFHFEASRGLARRRLADTRQTIKLLSDELREGGE